MSLSAYRSWDEYRPELSKEKGASGRTPDSLFKDAIQRDPSLCNSCFTERAWYVSLQWKCGEQGWKPYKRRYYIAGKNDPDPNQDLRHDGGPICCAECGMASGQDRPLSYRQATAHAGRISEALSNRGIDHDRRTLLAVTVDRVRLEDTTGVEDAKVFPQAVSEAVRACQ